MPESTRRITQAVWNALLPSPFDLPRLASGIIDDCGIDATGLAPHDIEKLYHDSFDGSWHDMTFACREVLAYYVANSRDEMARELDALSDSLVDVGGNSVDVEGSLNRLANSCDDVAGRLDCEQFVQAVFVALSLGHAMRHGRAEWESCFRNICELILRNFYRIDDELQRAYFAEIVCPPRSDLEKSRP